MKVTSKESGDCQDSLEIRYNLPGQPGMRSVPAVLAFSWWCVDVVVVVLLLLFLLLQVVITAVVVFLLLLCFFPLQTCEKKPLFLYLLLKSVPFSTVIWQLFSISTVFFFLIYPPICLHFS